MFTEHPEWYEYALMLCNINNVRDDVFNVSLNGTGFGTIPELGVNACGGRMWATNPIIKAQIDEWAGDPCIPGSGSEPVNCCFDNAFPIIPVPKTPFLQENWVVQMDNVVNNHSGNFGGVYIWKLRRMRDLDGEIIPPDPCLYLWTTTYSGSSGSNITIDFAARESVPRIQVLVP
ncbi:MAG: hypothetical protein HY253_12930 [Burkholderiales bacterium]|nr:hypothetical protein [Burkholderiales bacterium]